MTIINDTLQVQTDGNCHVIDLTNRLSLLLSKHKFKIGHAVIFVAGSTAALTTIEFESGLKRDICELFDRLAPKNMRYFHEETWNDGNGHSHVRASLLGPTLTVPFEAGKFMLGTWQQIILIDFDNRPRSRSIIVQFIGE